MSLDLKHIPCPAGDACTAFQCIFGHKKDKNTPAPEPKAKDKTVADKRRAQDDDRAANRTLAPTTSDETRPKSSTNKSSVNVELDTVKRPVSPPPLKRPASGDLASSSPPYKKLAQRKQTPSSAATSSPKSKPPPPTKARVKQTDTKPESLNPRLLKNSPASHQIRVKLLKMLHAEYERLNKELKADANDEEEKLLLTDQQLIDKALLEEQSIAIEKASVYANVMKNKVMSYKRMKVGAWKDEMVKSRNTRPENDDNGGEKPIEVKTGLTPTQEVQILQQVLTPIDRLSQHGYVPEVPSDEAIKRAKDGKEAADGWEKCDRCQQRFQVFPGRREEDGALTSGGTCAFHWGKTYLPTKAPGDKSRVAKRYQCCGEAVGDSVGCFTQNYHVYKAGDAKTLAAVLNFAKTPENPNAPADRAVGFDCEMAYTVHGLELIRLTAVSWPDGAELLDVLVQPIGEILDLNSRYSGVWTDDMARAQPWTSAKDSLPSKDKEPESGSEDGEVRKKNLHIVSSPEIARSLLFSLIAPTTPLIGHGLENDLNAVRIVHPTLVDTALLYPHKAGLPFRNGLKSLMDYHLNRKIQQETGPKVVGHDSAEDARAAGELVRLKVSKEWPRLERAGWKVEDGRVVKPKG